MRQGESQWRVPVHEEPGEKLRQATTNSRRPRHISAGVFFFALRFVCGSAILGATGRGRNAPPTMEKDMTDDKPPVGRTKHGELTLDQLAELQPGLGTLI